MLLEEIKVHPTQRMKLDSLEKRLTKEDSEFLNQVFRAINLQDAQIQELEADLDELLDNVKDAKNSAEMGIDQVEEVINQINALVREGEVTIEGIKELSKDLEVAIDFFDDIKNLD